MDWFFHDPGQGRVGPLSADELRERYRQRRIQRDTLVWREGMREWQPLDRMAEELDLLSVKPDATVPPPLPPGAAAPSAFAATPGPVGPAGAGYGATRMPPRRKGMSGCLIALIVCVVLAVPVVAILAAIAVPAYNDYLVRSKITMQVDARAAEIEAAVTRSIAANGRCPVSSGDVSMAGLDGVDFGTVDGRCAFQLTIRGIRPQVDGKTVVFVAPPSPEGAWDCSGGDLPAKYRRPLCRATQETAR